MEKIVYFASEQWLLITALAAAIYGLIFLENKRAGTGLSPQGLTSLVNGGDTVVVDLREKEEFAKGHIVDARNLPYKSIQSKLTQKDVSALTSEFEDARDKKLVLVCKMGQHSSQLAKKLAENNFNVYRLAGGVMEWQNAQLPLVKGKK